MTATHTARRLALVAVAAMVAALLPFAGASAQTPGDGAPPPPNIALALQGQTTIDSSLRWSQVAYADETVAAGQGPTEALLGRDDLFADSLASGVLQGAIANGRPLLLTPSDSLDGEVLAELQRLDVDLVHVLGLEDAIEETVVTELEAAGFATNRFGGETRTETAIDIAEAVGGDTAIIARSFEDDEPTQAWADSLATGGWAAEDGFPVLLTQTETLTPSTAAHIEEAGYSRVIIVGGERAVSLVTEAQLQALVATVDRVEGDTRVTTAIAVAEARGYAGPDDASGVILVDGQGTDAWADGFAAANVSGIGWPIVLANSTSQDLPQATRVWLGGTAGDPTVPGGPGDPTTPADPAFSQTVLADQGNVVLICGTTAPDSQCAEAATILDATVVTFTGEDVESSASPSAQVVTVDGEPVEPSSSQSVEVTDGSVTFTAIADEEEDYVAPVVETEDGAAPTFDENGAPVEAFGVSPTRP
ncbi:hypothetical protein BH23ACT9_BH23ACT9_36900 [soil metagenome]